MLCDSEMLVKQDGLSIARRALRPGTCGPAVGTYLYGFSKQL